VQDGRRSVDADRALLAHRRLVVLRPLPYRDPERVVMVCEDATSIGLPFDAVDAGTATTISWSEARRRIHAAAGRGPRAWTV